MRCCWIVLLCSALGAALLAACSSSGQPTASTGAEQDNGSLYVADLGLKMVSQMQNAKEVELAGTVTSNGAAVSADLHYGEAATAGWVNIQGGRAQIIATSVAEYEKATDALLRELVPADQLAKVKRLRGKWIKVPLTTLTTDARQLAHIQFVTQRLAADIQYATFTKVPGSTVAGHRTVGLRASGGMIFQVAAVGPAYPLKITGTIKDLTVSLTLTHWNEPFTPVIPHGSDVFDTTKQH